MSIKILTKNAIDNTNIDGARTNHFNAGQRSGIVKGAFNQGNFFIISSNIIALDTCELRISGHQVIIDELKSFTISVRPNTPTRYSLIAEINVNDQSVPEFRLFIQPAETKLIQNNLFKTENGSGIYQLKIGNFTVDTNGNVIDIVRIADIITGASENGYDYINIGEVKTNMLSSGVDAEVDIENVLDEESGEKKTNFTFNIPETAGTAIDINGEQQSGLSFISDPQTQINDANSRIDGNVSDIEEISSNVEEISSNVEEINTQVDVVKSDNLSIHSILDEIDGVTLPNLEDKIETGTWERVLHQTSSTNATYWVGFMHDFDLVNYDYKVKFRISSNTKAIATKFGFMDGTANWFNKGMRWVSLRAYKSGQTTSAGGTASTWFYSGTSKTFDLLDSVGSANKTILGEIDIVTKGTAAVWFTSHCYTAYDDMYQNYFNAGYMYNFSSDYSEIKGIFIASNSSDSFNFFDVEIYRRKKP